MDSPCLWFAIRATYKREFIAQEYLQDKGIEVIVPLKKVIKVVGGIKRKVAVPAINNLIFVRATKDELKDAKRGAEYIQYLTRRENGRKSRRYLNCFE